MSKINALNNRVGFEVLESANCNSKTVNENRESDIISLSKYRDRIKTRISPDRNPPPCILAKVA